jgi:hypothetical protein
MEDVEEVVIRSGSEPSGEGRAGGTEVLTEDNDRPGI